MSNILIIDDDKMLCEMVCRHVEYMGHESAYALTLEEGHKKVSSKIFDLVFLDVRLPDGNGLDALPGIRKTPSQPEVIIITGEGDPDGAELAIKSGAWDYIEKPTSIEKMTLPLVRALQYRKEKAGRKPAVALKRDGIVGDGPRMKSCFDLLAQAAISDVNVLITGETGTGKELFAQAVHENSSRYNNNFVVVDCAALPDTLVESVLFGHEKGAFTGADRKQDGLIKQADNGTLFLDEVGELPLPVQKTFLRVLQEHRFRPVGGKQEIKSDFRLVAATNKDLDEMVQSGRFRNDLMFRLRALTIKPPPLREHIEDIKALSMYHVAKFCERHQIGTKGFSPEFFEALSAYDWPGNVRELVNTLETSFAAARHDHTLFATHLPVHIRVHAARISVGRKPSAGVSAAKDSDYPKTFPSLRDFRIDATAKAEKQYLQDLISSNKSNISEARRISGLSRSRLYELLKKHKISFP